jgi:hypothetical protein
LKADKKPNIVNSQNNHNNLIMSEGSMPDYSNYIKDKTGDFWKKEKKDDCVYRIILEKPVYTTIPQEVLLELIRAKNKK